MSAYKLVHRMLEASSDRSPDAIALVHGDKRYTYGDLESQANRLAALLADAGVRRGQRVALLAANGVDYVAGFFGILKSGGCVVALNKENKPRTQQKLLADSGAVALVTRIAQARQTLPDIVSGGNSLRLVVVDRENPKWDLPAELNVATQEDVAAFADTRVDREAALDEPAAILYTSGSTGMPRGATLTHKNLAANTRQILAYLHLTPEDSVVVVLPFHYSFGNSLLLTHVEAGGRLVVENRFAYPQVVVDTMAKEQVSGFSGVPSTYTLLCNKTDFLVQDLPHLRYITQAGGAMSPALTRRIREALPDRVRAFVMYGQTEASARLSYVPPDRLLEKLGSIGIPIPGVTLTVRRPDGSECDLDEVGEIVAGGDNVMQGYWNDPDETALVLSRYGLHSGDQGRKDQDGFIFLVDRIKNMINCGAHRVSPKEIEETIAEVPGVVEVCVVGVADELLGEAIEAFVAPAPGSALDEKAILQHCHQNLAPFKIPRTIHWRDSLPKNAAGKVVKAELVKSLN